MPICINYNIFRFKVSIDDFILVQDFKGKEDLSCVEFDPVLLLLLTKSEVHFVLNHPVEILARAELKDEIYRFLVSKSLLHTTEEILLEPRLFLSCMVNMSSGHSENILLGCLLLGRESYLSDKLVDLFFVFQMFNPLGFVYGSLRYLF